MAAKGDRLDTLRVPRDRLAVEIQDSGSVRDVAALSTQLRETLAEIDALGAKTVVTQEDSTFDELSRQRADRGRRNHGGATVPPAASRVDVPNSLA